MARKTLEEIVCPNALQHDKKMICHLSVADVGFPVLKQRVEDTPNKPILFCVNIHLKFKVYPKPLLQII